ncbi:MAG: GNAT family N-acetyltransferase [Chitinophagales bacterium]|nr:GNAT family N-acetyltransferase [Chitinophagales bacterium]
MLIQYTQNVGDVNQYRNHFAQCEASFISALTTRVNIEEYCAKLVEKAVNFEAWEENQLVGMVNAYFNVATETAYITNVSVVVGHQGKGIASILLDKCIKFAAEKQLKSVSLEVASTNTKAQALYKKYGFSVSGSKEDYFIMTKQI